MAVDGVNLSAYGGVERQSRSSRTKASMRHLLGALLAMTLFAADAAERLAPDPKVVREAVVQIYGARAVGIKGLFGVHTWIAVKPTDALKWTVYEVIGWRLARSGNVVVIRNRQPDAWYGVEPELYSDKRGEGVDELIARIDKAAHEYPYATAYTLWPGPNSNTFTAWITRAVPELECDLPATAIGKDYLGGAVLSKAPSGAGIQLSLGGLLGVSASAVEGLELNVLGLNFGLGPNGIKLPMIGRISTSAVRGAFAGEEPAKP